MDQIKHKTENNNANQTDLDHKRSNVDAITILSLYAPNLIPTFETLRLRRPLPGPLSFVPFAPTPGLLGADGDRTPFELEDLTLLVLVDFNGKPTEKTS